MKEGARQRGKISFSSPQRLNYGADKCFSARAREKVEEQQGWKTAPRGAMEKIPTSEAQVKEQKCPDKSANIGKSCSGPTFLFLDF